MARKMSKDFNEVLDDINFAEHRRFRQMGFSRGHSIAGEAGWREGYAYGVRKGAQIAAEIGFYQGFVHAWLAILEKEDINKQRKLTALRTLLEMTRNFPKSNQIPNNDADDLNLKLARIRAKFKQVNALLNFDPGAASWGSGGIFGSSFSGSQEGSYPTPSGPQPPPQQTFTPGSTPGPYSTGPGSRPSSRPSSRSEFKRNLNTEMSF